MKIPYEIEPVPRLQSKVKCFWVLEEPPAYYNRTAAVPDPFVELVFNCGAPVTLVREDGQQIPLPPVMINGLQTNPLRFNAAGLCQFVSVRLYPWALVDFADGFRPLAGTPLLVGGDSWAALGRTLVETVKRRGYDEALCVLQAAILDQQRTTFTRSTPVQQAAELLISGGGQSRMTDIAAQCYLSTSQFERQFKNTIGLTPKTFARLVRFRAAWEALYFDPGQGAIGVAQTFGYSDQSHLIRDFKAFANQTPGNVIERAKTFPLQFDTVVA